MSHKGIWICKCRISRNITQKQIREKKYRKCNDCGQFPLDRQVNKAIKQIKKKK